jgi:hypothetical protein
MDLEIDPTDVVELADQTFFLLSEREAKSVSVQCFKRFAWFPVVVESFDPRLPTAGKGMQWIATEILWSVDETSAMAVVYGMRPVESMDHATAVVEFLSDRPELLTTGQAQRGFDQLRNYVYGNA